MPSKGIPYKGLNMLNTIKKAGFANTARELKTKEQKDKRGSQRTHISRDYNILIDITKGNGYSDLTLKYGISRQRIEAIVKEWYNMANTIMTKKEKEPSAQ